MYTVVLVSFEISTPDFLQVSVKATGESTISFRCMVQCRINLVPANGVPIVGEDRMTVGVGTVHGKNRRLAFQNTALHIQVINSTIDYLQLVHMYKSACLAINKSLS